MIIEEWINEQRDIYWKTDHTLDWPMFIATAAYEKGVSDTLSQDGVKESIESIIKRERTEEIEE